MSPAAQARERCGGNGSNAVTVPALMIYKDPPDLVLKSADIVALYYPDQPRWYKVLVDLDPLQPRSPRGYLVVDIPVDSTDGAVVESWRVRIIAARA